MIRRGGRLTVYLHAWWAHLTGRLGSHDVVVDVQNGLPFLSALWCRRPLVVLVHHVHREQWPVVMPPLQARVGWWIESRVAPRLHRHARYVAVSEATRQELVGLGVRPGAITVVHNGMAVPAPAGAVPRRRSRRCACSAGWCPTSGSSWPWRRPPASASTCPD